MEGLVYILSIEDVTILAFSCLPATSTSPWQGRALPGAGPTSMRLSLKCRAAFSIFFWVHTKFCMLAL